MMHVHNRGATIAFFYVECHVTNRFPAGREIRPAPDRKAPGNITLSSSHGVPYSTFEIAGGQATAFGTYTMRLLISATVALGIAQSAIAVGSAPCLIFPPEDELGLDSPSISYNGQQRPFRSPENGPGFIIAHSSSLTYSPILTDSNDDEAVHIAVRSFADDIEQVTGGRPSVWNDTLPRYLVGSDSIVVSTVSGPLTRDLRIEEFVGLKGMWESYAIKVLDQHGLQGIGSALVIQGSDRRGTIYALYTLSEQMGVSPWYWWADVPPTRRQSIVFPRDTICGHSEPSVKYRGIFINDEVPVLWNFAREHFNISWPESPFQIGIYEKMFELILRLKGNYLWPSMYFSMFDVDGLNPQANGIPRHPLPGPNQVMAHKMGIVMGTSHHEPMSRNKPEWDQEGRGSWDWTNKETLIPWWEYGAERARTSETLYTLGLRGDGDRPLDGANKELLEEIVGVQQGILQRTYKNTTDAAPFDQIWCMYKEVQGYFAQGMKVPDNVTIMFADDNYGNIMQVLDPEMNHPAGAGIYYHADYKGHPRDWKWINIVNLVKTWEQLSIARAFHTDRVWILNVGDLKNHELPTDHFLTLAYDFERWPRNSMHEYLELWAGRDFGAGVAKEVADIMSNYGVYSARRHAELISPTTFSYVNYDEADRVAADWDKLVHRAQAVYDELPSSRQPAFFELVLAHSKLLANLNKLYMAVGKNDLYSQQALISGNVWAEVAMKAFKEDYNITEQYHRLLNGKWPHIMDQTHINFQHGSEYWPMRNTLPPISFVNPLVPALSGPEGVRPGQAAYVRITVENSQGAWPDHNQFNCKEQYDCAEPVLHTMSPYGVQHRWVRISSSGPRDVTWKALARQDWLNVHPAEGLVRADGAEDAKVILSIDWAKVPSPTPKNASVLFAPDDGSNVTVTIPIFLPPRPPSQFRGFIAGDGYVAMEAAHFTRNASSSDETYAFQEIIDIGHTLSGLEIFPMDATNHSATSGPHVQYDFWIPPSQDGKEQDADVIVQIAPSLNFLSGKKLAYAISLDGSEPVVVTPIPASLPPPNQAIPLDWDTVVSDDVRSNNLTFAPFGKEGGRHRLTVHGMTTGIVLERIVVDLGGVQSRGYTYLGPPESMRV